MDITSFDLETNEPRVVSLTDASVDPSRVPGLEPFEEKLAAWETVDVGRYRPRRVRGSYLGRELG